MPTAQEIVAAAKERVAQQQEAARENQAEQVARTEVANATGETSNTAASGVKVLEPAAHDPVLQQGATSVVSAESGIAASQQFASSVGNSTQLQSPSTIPQASQEPQKAVVLETVVVKSPATREFQHVYAGAGVNLPSGKRLTFGGAPGGNGRYVTGRKDEIDYLAELAATNGSQVTEIFRDNEGREVARGAGSSLESDFRTASQDAARNTLLDTDPNISSARNNLPNVIKMNG